MRPGLQLQSTNAQDVSIHASVKDATPGGIAKKLLRHGFNPRICKRCDSCWSLKTAASRCFNPRICKRCDDHIGYQPIYIKVSIHASVKDATRVRIAVIAGIGVSIHASLKDATSWVPVLVAHLFCFNPRICKRCDYIFASVVSVGLWFQSTHL